MALQKHCYIQQFQDFRDLRIHVTEIGTQTPGVWGRMARLCQWVKKLENLEILENRMVFHRPILGCVENLDCMGAWAGGWVGGI